MNNLRYDVAIIGGGLAGLTLAIQLARSEKKVILFEKEKFPFHKVCGEYISMESYDFIERIGIPLSELKLPLINEVLISSPQGNSIIRPLDLGGFGISRYTLDSMLAELAASLGVYILQETVVQNVIFQMDHFEVQTLDQTYFSTIACGAYGKRSSIERKLNPNDFGRITNKKENYIGIKYHILTKLDDHRIELHNFKDGYCGISKIDNNQFCLCYMTTAKNLRSNNNSIKQMEKNVLFKNPYLKKYFSESKFIYKEPLVISQLKFSTKFPVQDHILMIGDAAGTIAPLCGNGMSMAMRSSFELFKLLETFFANEIDRSLLEKRYKEKWNYLFKKRINLAKYIQHLFGGVYLTNLVISFLKQFPFIADKIIRLTHGKKF